MTPATALLGAKTTLAALDRELRSSAPAMTLALDLVWQINDRIEAALAAPGEIVNVIGCNADGTPIDPVLVPRGLLGAASSAIDKKRDAPTVLAELRRWALGAPTVRATPAPGGAVPDGWKLMPREPDEAMQIAAFGVIMDGGRQGPITSDRIRQMHAISVYQRMWDALRAHPPGGAQAGGMDMDAFAVENRVRCTAPNGFHHPIESWSLSDWMTATFGELGEAANVAKKLNRVRDGVPGNTQSEEELRAALADEIADTFIYLDLLAQSQGIRLSQAVRSKFDRTSAKIGYATPPAAEVQR